MREIMLKLAKNKAVGIDGLPDNSIHEVTNIKTANGE